MHTTVRIVIWLGGVLCIACNSNAMPTSGESTPATSDHDAPLAPRAGAPTAAAGAPGRTPASGAAQTSANTGGAHASLPVAGATAGARAVSAAGSGGAGGQLANPTGGMQMPAGAGGMSASAGAGTTSAGASGASTTPSAPVFTKTRCIDPSQVTPGVEVSFPCDGVNIWVALPEACKAHSCGLIFNIHGGGMTDHATMDQATNMIALGNQADYVVVHPHKGTWDVANDKDAVFDFLQQTIQAFGIDPKRVHSTGYSQGGQISWALGCEHADVVASIAPAEEVNRVSDCWKTSKLPARELPILFAYGKQDSIGGGYDAATELAGQVASTSKMMGPETIAGKEGSTYWRQRWTSASGNVFEFISHDYTSTGVGGILAGHCLPMASGTTFVNCSTPVDYDWGQEVVRFFQAHPM
jgi:hypothetical protein